MNWTEFFLNIIEALVMAGLAAFLPVGFMFLQKKLGVANTNAILSMADTVVKMVEQQLENAPGSEKKAVAVDALKAWADARHVDIKDSELHTAIEAAVFSLPKKLEWTVSDIVPAGSQKPDDAAIVTPVATTGASPGTTGN